MIRDMKITILLISFAFCYIISFSQSIYYVQDKAYNANASDMNAGTDINFPWATWQKAFDTADEGDTVYFRGGVWYPTRSPNYEPSTGHGNNGSYGNPICFFNYPGEQPVLDLTNQTSTVTKQGLRVYGVTHAKFKGLEVRNCKQIVSDQYIISIEFNDCGNIYLEQIKCHDGGGYGIYFAGYDTLYLINCDSYSHADSWRSPDPGNRADGFQLSSGSQEGDYLYMSGCRAWNNSDDGIEISTMREFYANNTWVFANGYLSGIGVGVKYGPAYTPSSERVTANLLLAYNTGPALADQNLSEVTHGPVGNYYNNTIYKCGAGFTNVQGDFDCAIGTAQQVIRNNIMYDLISDYNFLFNACGNNPYVSAFATIDHNNFGYIVGWPYSDELITTTDADFLALPADSADCVAILTASRQSDGSLPDIGNYFHLAANSDLIDAGVNVGLSFNGPAPDIGYAEYEKVPGSGNQYPYVKIAFPLNSSTLTHKNIIINAAASDADGSISKVEFFYDDTIRIGEANSYPWSFSWNNAPLGNHSIRAVATDNQNAIATSSRINITIIPGDINNTDVAILFPNPNDGYFTLFFASPLVRKCNVTILSLEGKVYFKGTMSAEETIKQFEMPFIKPGFYILMLSSTEIIFAQKFIKV